MASQATPYPTSPGWHRRLRKVRAALRKKIKARREEGLSLRHSDVDILEAHHSGPRYRRSTARAPVMGKTGQSWRSDNSQSWGSWPGAYSYKGETPWRTPAPKRAAFPTYNSRPPSESTQATGHGRPEDRECDGSGLNSLQALLNAARKAEQRVSRIQAAVEKAKVQWADWQQDMRSSWLKEKERFHRDQDRLQQELAEAMAAQQLARVEVQRGFVPREEPKPDSEDEWSALTASWEQEAEDGNEEVLRRALMARFRGDCFTPMRDKGMARSPPPTSAGRPSANDSGAMAPPGLAPEDIYTEDSREPVASDAPTPGALTGAVQSLSLDSPPTGRSVNTGRRDPSLRRVPTSVEAPRPDVKQSARPQHPFTEQVQHKSMSQKLEERRQAEARALRPFGGAGRHGGQRQATFVEDDEDASSALKDPGPETKPTEPDMKQMDE